VGPVERAVRTKLREGEELLTPGQGRPFVVHRIRTDGIVLLLGEGRWRTLVPWEALEGVPDLLNGRGWVRTSGGFTVDRDATTLSGYLKQYVNRETANWVAVVLAAAGILELDRARPITARLRGSWEVRRLVDAAAEPTDGSSHTGWAEVSAESPVEPVGLIAEAGTHASARRADTARSDVEGSLELERNVEHYLRSRNPTGRYSSFDYCFNYFQSANEAQELDGLTEGGRMEVSCLQLAFYLASWGMLRGSSALLKRSVKHYEPAIRALVTMPAELWNVDADLCGDRADVVLGAARQLRSAFPDGASDILVTKVMLGVFGCVPAFDTYFKRGFGVSSFNRQSLRKVQDFYEQNATEIESHRVATLDFATGASTTRRYPRAKIIDMHFFIAGVS
jgi:hypothetical protein